MPKTVAEITTEANVAFDKIEKGVDGVVTDVEGLKKKIDEMNATPGVLTPQDEALFAEIVTRANNLAAKVEALDQATEGPIIPPVEPPVEPPQPSGRR